MNAAVDLGINLLIFVTLAVLALVLRREDIKRKGRLTGLTAPGSNTKVAERLVGHVQRYSEKNGFGFIACPACRDQFGRDAQLFQEDWEALELHVGSAVSFVLSFEERFPCPKGRPWAAEIQKLEQ
ncbi:S5A_REDUCTASE domain-containing protein [Durusdinium trenchii]|uniref:S5A_REDUCTASE domain-containing protein n=1 Tax=Durusdinium trenchii TaxID=1381693 RepID=A0ABP0R8J8_9DINO